ncbi:MAG: hypothetical protein ABIH67_02580 [Candidatus Uhrbacteria bacterium]
MAGLHGSGKSHLAKLLANEFDWQVINKLEILEQIFIKHDNDDGICLQEWYGNLYRLKGAAQVMHMILDYICVENKIILFDAIHNFEEWQVVQDLTGNQLLALVVSPTIVTDSRNTPEDIALDLKRVKYWHQADDGAKVCLISNVEWVFNGAGEQDLLLAEGRALSKYLDQQGWVV